MFKTFFTILLFVLFSGFNSLLAQVTTLTDWTLHAHTTSTAAVNANRSIPVGTNSNRILVVAIASSRIDAGTRTVTVTYGGRALTLASGDMGSATRQHSAIYYLNEAGLDAAVGTTLSVTVATGTTAITDVWYAVFDRVNQVSPITNSQNYNSGTGTVNPIQFSTALTINTNNLALKVISSVRTGNTSSRTISNFGTNWTLTNQQTGSYNTNGNQNDLGIRNAIGTRAIPTTNTTDVSSVTLSNATLASMSGVSLNNAPKYFRSVVTTGLWSNLSTWQESFNNSSWVAATTLPTEIDAQVTIQAGNTVTLTGATVSPNLIVNGTLDAATYLLTGTGTLTANNGSNILIGGTANFPTGFTTATLNAGSTVNYNGAAQTVAARNYANLTFSGSNTKTLQTGTTSITGNLTLSGTTSATAVVGLTIGGSVIIGSGTTFNASSFTHLVGGNWTNNGGTFTPATSTITFTGNSSQINGSVGSQTFNNFTVNKTAGQTLSVGGSTTSIIINGTTLLSTGVFSAPLTLTLGGNFTNNSNGFIANSGTVSMNGSGFTIGGSVASTFNNLTINNAGGTLLGQSIVVNNSLTLTNGRLTLNAYNMTLGVSALPIAGTFNTSNMIIATSTGQVRKLITTNASYFFPVGDATGTAEYSPITVNFSSGTYAAGAYVSVRVTNTKHPNNSSTSNFLNRYWTVGQSGITSFLANISATYLPADISGVESGQVAARYTGSLPWVKYATLGSNTLSVTNLTSFGDFTGINNIPFLSTNPTTLSAFTYTFGNGPSQILSFTVSGTDLNENVVVFPSTSFEISVLGGLSFDPVNSISLAPSGGVVNAQTVYVRMKEGLAQGAVASQNIAVTTSGATTVNVACSGTVTVQPLITLATSPATNPTSLTGFSYNFKSASTIERTFTVTGTNLLGNVEITPPTNYEISLTTGTGFVSTPIVIAPSGGTLPAPNPRTIYVRLKSGLGVGNYAENIVVSSQSADNKTVALTGVVNPIATLTTSTAWLAGFIYTQGSGPSKWQTFQLNGVYLGTNVVTVTPPADFELSTNGTTWNTSAFSITPVGGTVNQTIYARLRSGRTYNVNGYGPQNVTLASTGAVVKTVALSGFVANAPTILVSKTTLTGFGYLFGSGPSVSQAFTVSGASLTNNITITPPANFQISLSPTSGFQSTAITLVRTSDTIAARPIFVRLTGLPAQDYGGSITVSSTPASNKTVTLSGKVFATPLITSTGGGNFCLGDNINFTSSGTDVQSQFWSGPNNFYATTANATLTNATESMSGNYTVTGNVIVGGNLIYNGDFELGNTGVGSSYSYVAPAANVLQPEDLYTIVATPSSVHSNFNNVGDHSPAPGTLQMVINGYRTAGVVVWSQSVPVVQNANYEFTYWLQTVVNGVDPAPSKLQLYVNGVMAGPIYTANPNSGNWAQYIYNTNAGSNTILNLELINQTTAANGNDFALDDISFKQILSSTSTQNVFVNPQVVASVNVTYSPTNVLQNSPVVFTANPVNGGDTPTYKWFVGGVEQVGHTASTFNYTPTTLGNLTVRCEMTSSIVCAAPKPALDTKVINVTAPLNYWMGYLDIDWGKPANWTAGYVPATGDDVIYATVANYGTDAIRDLQLDKNRTIGNLINATIRRLLIPANLTLNCNNIISVTPPVTNPVTNVEDLIYIHASETLPNGSIIFRNPQDIPAHGTVEMFSPATWDLSRPINQKYNWQFFGIPVASLPALPTFYGAYVRELFENDKDTATHWRSLNNESVLQPFIGYELCQQTTKFYTFKGQLINSNYSSGQFIKTTDALYPGQHLFANPYTAAMDIKMIEFGTGVESTAYLYATGSFVQWRTNKKVTNGAIPGQYFAVPKEQAGIPGIPRQVPSMGTLMVRIPQGAPSTELSYVNFNYNTVTMGNSERQRAKAASTTDNQATTTIDVESENAADRMWIMSGEGYTRNFDNGFDGKKLIGNALSPQLFAVENDGIYQVNSVDDLNNTTLAFQAGQDTEYKMTFTHDENTQRKYKKLFLHDLLENKVIDITLSGTEYLFSAATTTKPVIRFKVLSQSENVNTDKSSLTKVYHFENQLYVQNFSEFAGKVYVYDISGRTVGIKSIAANQNIQIRAPKNNTYIVKIVVGDSTETSKIFLQ